MKKILSLLLAIAFAACVGCSNASTSDQSGMASTEGQSSAISSTEATTSEDASSSNESKNNSDTPGYENIQCFTPSEYKEVYFIFGDDTYAILLPIPKEWQIKKDDNGLQILHSGAVVGTIVSGTAKPTSGGKSVYNTKAYCTNIDIDRNIYEYTANGESKFEHIFNYKYINEDNQERYISIKTDYYEIGSSTISKFTKKAKIIEALSKDNLGVMKLTDNRKKILILGNSFIRSSKIGETLSEMCKNDYAIEASDINNAKVATYATDKTWVNKIKSGQYSAVFMCGFYADGDAVGNFKTIVDACKASSTKLAIFPAHNENNSTINKAATENPDIPLLNWKKEIEMLIGTGIDTSNFCIDDSYKHSSPLAGYVGAHMIYRAIYDKMPPIENMVYTNVSAAQIRKLGKYTTNCSKVLVDSNKLYYFK